MKIYNTACPRNCYSTCSFKVGVEDNKVLSIEPQPLNKATPKGVCLKGLSYVERTHSKDRILYPLKKVNGVFKQISWEDALNEIASKITNFKKDYGNHSILFYAASGSSGLLNEVSSNFWRMIGGATTVYGNLCWPAGLEAVRLTLGDTKHNIAWDLENAKLIILWGKNPAETNIQQMIPIEKAQAKGAKLVVIDPRRTASAERADLLLQAIPGTDAILALAIAKLLIDNQQVNHSFVKEHVLGFDEFKHSLSDLSLEFASQECGIPVYLIEKLAHWIATIRPMTIVPGYGMQRFSNGGQTIRCLLTLQILTGNIGKSGATFHYADIQGDIFSSVKEPMSYFPPDKPTGVFRREISTARLGEDMMKLVQPELKMVWVERGNPITQNPDSAKVKEAFRKLEFRVVVEQFLTDTALEADIVLPAKSMFDQSDIISSYWNPYIQFKPKVMDAPGEVKPETEIYYLLAQKLGFDVAEIEKYIPKSDDESIRNWLTEKLKPFPEISLEQLEQGPCLAPGLQEIAFDDFKFNTPSGKIELYSEYAKEKWDVSAVPSYEKTLENKQHSNHKIQLLSPNTKNRIHSQFGNLDLIKTQADDPFVLISYRDAKNMGLRNGDILRVFNDRGELKIKAKIDASLRPGCVSICNGYWHQEGACPNTLSKGRETDMGYGAAFHDCMVSIGRIEN
ncbi:MAG: molybdopterin-dependent oxidoreductase [Salinivirgaceae bacterium]|nr:molybdopterin-dependent oxidoreductase [Salinivirgaceae bacterium]